MGNHNIMNTVHDEGRGWGDQQRNKEFQSDIYIIIIIIFWYLRTPRKGCDFRQCHMLTWHWLDPVWLIMPHSACWSHSVRITTGYCTLSPWIQPAAFCKIHRCHTLTVGHHINSVCQTVWYHGHKLARNRPWGNRAGWEKASAERETVERRRESLTESVFTGVQASPPNKNSFHVSSLPTCPYTNVYGGRLTHLMMSFP